jgi:hypothetical protein
MMKTGRYPETTRALYPVAALKQIQLVEPDVASAADQLAASRPMVAVQIDIAESRNLPFVQPLGRWQAFGS